MATKQKAQKPSVEEQAARVAAEEATENAKGPKDANGETKEERRARKKAERKAKKEEEKKNRKPKVAYPGLNTDAEGKTVTKLETWPADFDSKVHLKLRRKDFTTAAPFLIRRAERLEAKAAELREEAALLGTAQGEQQKKLKKLGKAAKTFQEKFTELAADLSPEEMQKFKAMFAEAMNANAAK